MSNWLPDAKRRLLVSLLLAGKSVRQVAALVPCSKVTVTRYRSVVRAANELYGEADMRMPDCECGKPAGHNGWCAPRYARSEDRQRFIEQWTLARAA